MDLVPLLAVVIAVLLAMATAAALARTAGAPAVHGRFASIDGLRGYLALGVYLHHACIWYFYLHEGAWRGAPSAFFNELGQAGVALFFMITAFLFFAKLLDARHRPIDWSHLLASRLLRITPLYLVVMLLLFASVAVLSHFELQTSWAALLLRASCWLGFTIPGAPALNGVTETLLIVAGATWSLPYEWFFYASLPLLALLVGANAGVRPVLLGVCFLALMVALWHADIVHFRAFGGGMLAAGCVRMPALVKRARTPLAAALACVCLAGVMLQPSVYAMTPTLLLTLAFVVIACGNSLFGVLMWPLSRTLGEIAYGMYLLHGLLLFAVFRFVLGLPAARALGAPAYWGVVIVLGPLLILLAFLAFRVIERPALRHTVRLGAWFARLGTTRPAAG